MLGPKPAGVCAGAKEFAEWFVGNFVAEPGPGLEAAVVLAATVEVAVSAAVVALVVEPPVGVEYNWNYISWWLRFVEESKDNYLQELARSIVVAADK